VLRRCVRSRNIKNGCSIYIYDISRLRVKFGVHMDKSCVRSRTGKEEECCNKFRVVNSVHHHTLSDLLLVV